jgi:hypothetical protein
MTIVIVEHDDIHDHSSPEFGERFQVLLFRLRAFLRKHILAVFFTLLLVALVAVLVDWLLKKPPPPTQTTAPAGNDDETGGDETGGDETGGDETGGDEYFPEVDVDDDSDKPPFWWVIIIGLALALFLLFMDYYKARKGYAPNFPEGLKSVENIHEVYCGFATMTQAENMLKKKTILEADELTDKRRNFMKRHIKDLEMHINEKLEPEAKALKQKLVKNWNSMTKEEIEKIRSKLQDYAYALQRLEEQKSGATMGGTNLTNYEAFVWRLGKKEPVVLDQYEITSDWDYGKKKTIKLKQTIDPHGWLKKKGVKVKRLAAEVITYEEGGSHIRFLFDPKKLFERIKDGVHKFEVYRPKYDSGGYRRRESNRYLDIRV